ncbi:helix-turn-helix transcriptional regulator [Actinoplanes sp. NPDC089786]|uniref:helix-turn-helix transcriptional regulator n=1 Tax=Actinoplanes sp. NPDC089786 TaxID=3155185 RepID=UPI003431B600
MTASDPNRETAHSIEALCRLGLDSRELGRRIGSHLSRRLTADAFCFGLIDPSTLLVTDHVIEGISSDAAADAAYNEYLVDDVLKFAELARAKDRVGILSEATGGDPTLSHRYRALLPLIDASHELRAAFVIDDRCWGGMSLYRSGSRPDFSPDDVDLFRRFSVTVAAALRRAAHRPASVAVGGPAEAGVLILDHDFRLLTANPAGQEWLEELATDITGAPPIAVLDVAARGKNSPLGAYARIRGTSGRWLSVQASPLTGDRHPATIAVLIQPAPASEVIEVLQLAYGLTPRERDILEQVISGRPSRAIAGLLHITTATVQDHLKSIFAKVGVRSRGELVARMLDGVFNRPS